MNPWINSLYGNFRTRKFTDIWPSFEEFKDDYNNSKLKVLDDDSLEVLYYMLYARYGNSHIASSDEEQFKYKMYTTIFMYGPTWVKRLELQEKLRDKSTDDLQLGAKIIYNHSYNPSTSPSTSTLEELDTINDQNTTNYKKSYSDALLLFNELLETDVTGYFLDRFKKLFLVIVEPELPLWYETDLVINGDDDDE